MFGGYECTVSRNSMCKPLKIPFSQRSCLVLVILLHLCTWLRKDTGGQLYLVPHPKVIGRIGVEKLFNFCAVHSN